VSLQRVDDHGGFVGIVHRDAREMNAASHRVGQLTPGADALVEDLAGFGIVRDAVNGRTDKRKVHIRAGVEVFGEAVQHASHILHAIPA
jgi:hypothetical protein